MNAKEIIISCLALVPFRQWNIYFMAKPHHSDLVQFPEGPKQSDCPEIQARQPRDIPQLLSPAHCTVREEQSRCRPSQGAQTLWGSFFPQRWPNRANIKKSFIKNQPQAVSAIRTVPEGDCQLSAASTRRWRAQGHKTRLTEIKLESAPLMKATATSR